MTKRNVPGATRHGNMMHGPAERIRCDLHPKRWRSFRWEWPVPDDGDHVASLESNAEPVTVRECGLCLALAEAETIAMAVALGDI